jgi:dihydroceramidase
MSPRFVFALLGFILAITTTIYYVRIPSELSSGLSNKSNTGYWGPPNSEFDWCEFNYLSSFYIAEPVNSFSMISFFVVIFRLFKHLRSILHTCTHSLFIFCEVCVVAVGSFFFHATLRYMMQLADELPMLVLVFHTSYVLCTRPAAPSNKRTQRPLLFISFCLYSLITTLILSLTDRASAWHHFVRGCNSYAFSAAFLYIFVAQSAAAADLDRQFPSTSGCSGKTFNEIFAKGLVCFVVALLGWIIENVACSSLQNLPFNMPFPHFHAILWHLGCAAG